MNAHHIRVLLAKEWAEIFQNRLVLFVVLALPLLFAALPVGIILGTSGSEVGGLNDLPPGMAAACGGLPANQCMQAIVVNQFMFLYLMLPLFIPVTIAAYSIVGEKNARTLEPLLAAPLTTLDLLIAKGLSAIIPAVLATWGSFTLMALALMVFGAAPVAQLAVLNPVWLTAITLVGPLASVLSVSLTMMISSRVNDPRAAEQLAGLLVIPLVGLMLGQMAGAIVVNLNTALTAAAVLALVDVGMVVLAVRVFQREVILTRWK